MDQLKREAMWQQKVGESEVRCLLCPHACLLGVGETGLCRSRQNQQGILIAVNYGQSIGAAFDPIEKKPLYHFRPGSQIISLGPNSCNLSCFFCQNFSSSQQRCPTHYLSPEALAGLVRDNCRDSALQVAFTYTEPFTWYEYIHDFAQVAADIDIVLVTNGFINPDPLKEILPFVKAMNIDLKSIKAEFYQRHCGGNLETVKQSIRMSYEAGTHIELTNLIIPGLNSSEAELLELAEFVASIDPDIPLHLSAYHPAYKSSIPATKGAAVLRACELAASRLSYVYAGNIYSTEYQATRCPNCSQTLISASRAPLNITADGTCSACHHPIFGVFNV